VKADAGKSQPIRVFISYSHSDEAFRARLTTSLAMMARQNLIESWHDRRITAGQEWRAEIQSEFERADVILLLFSPDFIFSQYCYDVEATRALVRHSKGECVVIPIIIRPCEWLETPFGELQALPRDGRPVSKWADPDEAFLDVARGIRALVISLRSSEH
jgi:hypothetical protein